jgi:hypothetical protein
MEEPWDRPSRAPDFRAAGDRRCDRCGSPEAAEVCESTWLCGDCRELAGSCCLEFGGDDLWDRVLP